MRSLIAALLVATSGCATVPPGDFCDIYVPTGPVSDPEVRALLIERERPFAVANVTNEDSARRCED